MVKRVSQVVRFLKLFRWCAASVAILLCIETPAMAADGDGLTPVRAAYIPVINWLPAWVAKEKGLFEKNGLNVSLTPAQNVSVLPGTLGRQFDLVPSTPPDLIKAVAGGLDVAAVTGETVETQANPTTHLIVRADSPIRSVADLKGRVVATPTLGAVIHAALLHGLKRNGIDPASIRAIEVPFPNMADQLKAGNVDAVEALDPFAGQLLAAGNRSIGDPLLWEGDDVLYTFWIAQGKWAETHRETIEAWAASLQQGKDFIDANPEEARAILAKYTRLPAAVVEKMPFPAYRFSLSLQDLGLWVEVLKDLGQIAGAIDETRLLVKSK
jgi:NitT/TauT family transport system substrate-binding protein